MAAGKLLLGLLLCGGVAADDHWAAKECTALIVQGDKGFTGFLYSSKTEKEAEIDIQNKNADMLRVCSEDYPDRCDRNELKPAEAEQDRGTLTGRQTFQAFHQGVEARGITDKAGNSRVVKNPGNLVNGHGTFNLDEASLYDAEGEQRSHKATIQALVRWYKEEIISMLRKPVEESDHNTPRYSGYEFRCRITKIVVRQTGKAREALLQKGRKSDRKDWVHYMNAYLKILRGFEHPKGWKYGPKILFPSQWAGKELKTDFALFSDKEQAALPAGDLTLDSTRYLVPPLFDGILTKMAKSVGLKKSR